MNVRHRSLFETLPQRSGPDECALVQMRMRRLVGCGTRENRIVAEHHPLDSEDRLFDFSTGVVTGPLPERPFEPFLVVTEFTFEHNLRIRGNRQTRICSPQHFQWLPAQTANPIELRKP